LQATTPFDEKKILKKRVNKPLSCSGTPADTRYKLPTSVTKLFLLGLKSNQMSYCLAEEDYARELFLEVI